MGARRAFVPQLFLLEVAMSEYENSPPPKKVGRGLEGLDVDVNKMSAKTREVYQDYLDIAGDEGIGGEAHEKNLRDAEHALRNAINADQLNQASGCEHHYHPGTGI